MKIILFLCFIFYSKIYSKKAIDFDEIINNELKTLKQI